MAQNDLPPNIPDFTPEATEHSNGAPGRGDRNRSGGGTGGEIIPTKLYVKRIPETVTSEELHDLFSKFGSVTECAIIRSYAFIHFSKPEEATRAVNELNGYRFMGIELEIEHSRSQSKSRRMSNRRDIYRTEEYGRGGGGRGGGRRDRERSPAYTGAYRADPYSPEGGYGGGYDYGQGGYGGYQEGYGGGYMGNPYRSPAPVRRGGFGPSVPRYPPPPPAPPQQYSNYPPHSPTGYQAYGPPRPRLPPPPPTGYYPPS